MSYDEGYPWHTDDRPRIDLRDAQPHDTRPVFEEPTSWRTTLGACLWVAAIVVGLGIFALGCVSPGWWEGLR